LFKDNCAELERSVLLISHGGRSDIDNHLETKKHKSSVEAVLPSSRVTHIFKAAQSNAAMSNPRSACGSVEGFMRSMQFGLSL